MLILHVLVIKNQYMCDNNQYTYSVIIINKLIDNYHM